MFSITHAASQRKPSQYVEMGGTERDRELPLLIKQHIGRLMHPPAPRPPPSFSSLYIF